MPDLFDNFFGKISTTFNGGKTKPRYSGNSQVNSGKYYNYHSNATNNNYWLPIKKDAASKPRSTSISSIASEEESKSRNNSVSSEKIDLEPKTRN